MIEELYVTHSCTVERLGPTFPVQSFNPDVRRHYTTVLHCTSVLGPGGTDRCTRVSTMSYRDSEPKTPIFYHYCIYKVQTTFLILPMKCTFGKHSTSHHKFTTSNSKTQLSLNSVRSSSIS